MYQARRPFDPLKLYRALDGKFILLQGEPEDDEDEEVEDKDDRSDSDSASEGNSASPENSDEASDNGEHQPMDSEHVLAHKKACPLFSGLHRSKGSFWLATRPQQMGSWSTAGAMLTLGSDMPWFCTIPEEEWMADEETRKNIKADYQGEWGDRRQEIVFIGERLDVEGLKKLFDGCLLTKAEMKKWEKVMKEENLSEEAKESRLAEMWDDGYWAEWVMEDLDEEGHEHHGHGHGHKH